MVTYILPHDKDGDRVAFLLPNGLPQHVFMDVMLFLMNERRGKHHPRPDLELEMFIGAVCSMDNGTNVAFLMWLRDHYIFPQFQIPASYLHAMGSIDSIEHDNACYFLSLLDDMNLLDMDGPKCLRKKLRIFVAAHRAKKQKTIQH
jgi:hypothetical protein